jgi:hypothetical protein
MPVNLEMNFIDPNDLEWLHLSPHNLQYVRKQTEELCLIAIKKDPKCLMYVRKQTLDLCLAAIKIKPEAAKYIKYEDLPEEDAEYLKLVVI